MFLLCVGSSVACLKSLGMSSLAQAAPHVGRELELLEHSYEKESQCDLEFQLKCQCSRLL